LRSLVGSGVVALRAQRSGCSRATSQADADDANLHHITADRSSIGEIVEAPRAGMNFDNDETAARAGIGSRGGRLVLQCLVQEQG